MPAQFNSFGIQFLYPDNWTIAEREEDAGDQGVTLDLPSGGFVSVEMTSTSSVDDLIDGLVEAIRADYEDLEREDLTIELLPAGTPVIDLRFYYLDLLIVSRLVVLTLPIGEQPESAEEGEQDVLVLQVQAESRDFDANEAVFSAILKQVVDAG